MWVTSHLDGWKAFSERLAQLLPVVKPASSLQWRVNHTTVRYSITLFTERGRGAWLYSIFSETFYHGGTVMYFLYIFFFFTW